MIHLGDINKINGADIPPVDVICGGSPCQDVSTAGLRAGISGSRSGLYFEQIRVIKEMRQHDRDIGRADDDLRPRYMVWENVPGALSSNKGEDFGRVITEAIRIAEPEAPDVPVPQAGWPNAGYLYDDMGRWSLAWRMVDAKYWGTPQRRKRICMVVDFCGLGAGRVLFDPQYGRITTDREQNKAVPGPGDQSTGVRPISESLSGDPQQGGEAREAVAGTFTDGVGASSYTLKIRGGCDGGGKGPLIQTELSGTLGTNQDQTLFVQSGFGEFKKAHTAGTLRSNAGEHGVSSADVICYPINTQVATRETAEMRTTFGVEDPGDPQFTIGANHEHGVCLAFPLEGNGSRPSHKGDGYSDADESYTLNTVETHGIAYCIGSAESNAWKSSNPHSGVYMADDSRTLDNNGGNPSCNQGGTMVVEPIMVEMTSTKNTVVDDGISPTLTARMGSGGNQVNVVAEGINGDIAGTIDASYYKGTGARSGKEREVVAVAGCDLRNARETAEESATLQAKPNGGASLNCTHPVRIDTVVRRLTPTECLRLQGFPDDWFTLPAIDHMTNEDVDFWNDVIKTNAKIEGKKFRKRTAQQLVKWYNSLISAESRKYKAIGNSIAVGFANRQSGFWCWLLKRISSEYERSATLGSLFDGIGGFPLAWEFYNGKGSAVWASEVDPYPIAVTKYHFGGEKDENQT